MKFGSKKAIFRVIWFFFHGAIRFFSRHASDMAAYMRINRHESDMAASAWPSLIDTPLYYRKGPLIELVHRVSQLVLGATVLRFSRKHTKQSLNVASCSEWQALPQIESLGAAQVATQVPTQWEHVSPQIDCKRVCSCVYSCAGCICWADLLGKQVPR